MHVGCGIFYTAGSNQGSNGKFELHKSYQPKYSEFSVGSRRPPDRVVTAPCESSPAEYVVVSVDLVRCS